jgi:hypothetical protein
MMEVTFLFLDESIDLDVAWLCGVAVPAEQYADTRDAVIRTTRDALIDAGHKHPHPTELHGACLLKEVPGITDEHRASVLERLVALVNHEQLHVVSVGHKNAARVRQTFRKQEMDPGDKLYNLNFYELVEVLRLPATALVCPVFDGVPGQPSGRATGRRQPIDAHAYETFMAGGFLTQWNRLRMETKPNPIVKFKPNLRNLGEPTFSDSRHSPLLQLADVIGYLLGVRDRAAQSVSSPWKTRVASIARKLDSELICRFTVDVVEI